MARFEIEDLPSAANNGRARVTVTKQVAKEVDALLAQREQVDRRKQFVARFATLDERTGWLAQARQHIADAGYVLRLGRTRDGDDDTIARFRINDPDAPKASPKVKAKGKAE